MRVALAQIISSDDPTANLALVADAVAHGAAAGAGLVILPEATMCCFGVPLRPIAEPLDGPWATRVREIARSAGVAVVVGMFTPDGDRVRNTLLVTGPGPRRVVRQDPSLRRVRLQGVRDRRAGI